MRIAEKSSSFFSPLFSPHIWGETFQLTYYFVQRDATKRALWKGPVDQNFVRPFCLRVCTFRSVWYAQWDAKKYARLIRYLVFPPNWPAFYCSPLSYTKVKYARWYQCRSFSLITKLDHCFRSDNIFLIDTILLIYSTRSSPFFIVSLWMFDLHWNILQGE